MLFYDNQLIYVYKQKNPRWSGHVGGIKCWNLETGSIKSVSQNIRVSEPAEFRPPTYNFNNMIEDIKVSECGTIFILFEEPHTIISYSLAEDEIINLEMRLSDNIDCLAEWTDHKIELPVLKEMQRKVDELFMGIFDATEYWKVISSRSVLKYEEHKIGLHDVTRGKKFDIRLLSAQDYYERSRSVDISYIPVNSRSVAYEQNKKDGLKWAMFCYDSFLASNLELFLDTRILQEEDKRDVYGGINEPELNRQGLARIPEIIKNNTFVTTTTTGRLLMQNPATKSYFLLGK